MKTIFLVSVALLAATGCATSYPWSADMRACAGQSLGWALLSAHAANTAKEQCMNARGWVLGGQGYRKPTPGEPTVTEMISAACKTEQRYGDSVWFQHHWVKCPN